MTLLAVSYSRVDMEKKFKSSLNLFSIFGVALRTIWHSSHITVTHLNERMKTMAKNGVGSSRRAPTNDVTAFYYLSNIDAIFFGIL